MNELVTGPAAAVVALVALAAAVLPPAAPAGSSIESYATVNDDATLQVRHKHIRLFGIHVPATSRYCRTTLRPARCAPRAALALDFKIRGFVECHPVRRHADRSISARCYNDGEDLGAYLIDRGWAVAAPGAPFEYTVIEKIARQHHRGVWGFNVDVIQPAR